MSEERGPNGERIVDIDCRWGEFPNCTRQEIDGAGVIRMFCTKSGVENPVATLWPDGRIVADATATCGKRDAGVDQAIGFD